MPKKGMTEAQEFMIRHEAMKLIMQHAPERVRLQPWRMANKMAAYLRYGDENQEFPMEGDGSGAAK